MPSYRDPVHDGATDPVVVHRRGTAEWWMFTTQRRALHEGPGVEWVHGTRIGVAVSTDAGLTWEYRGTVDGLPGETQWAPEVVFERGGYHMFLTVIEGVHAEWSGHERHIVHLTSPDLIAWTSLGAVPLSSDYVIDAAIARSADGAYRMWFKDEADDSTTWSARSDDLVDWTVEGRVIGGVPHEGPNVFRLGGWVWMLVDEWRGQGVFRSADGLEWERQGLVLDRPGRHPDDAVVGRHADVIEQGDHAWIVYFTHPHWDGVELGSSADPMARRSVVRFARAEVVDDRLVVDRDVSDELALVVVAEHDDLRSNGTTLSHH